MKMVAEGVATCRSAVDLAHKHHTEMAIFSEVYDIMFNGKDAHAAMHDLMTREIKGES
jgi:glycerol-3-phosphate dehydrogenase (NAD(P)+)